MLNRLFILGVLAVIGLQWLPGTHGSLSTICLGGEDLHAIEHGCDADEQHEIDGDDNHAHEHCSGCGCVDIPIAFPLFRESSLAELELDQGNENTDIHAWRLIAIDDSACVPWAERSSHWGGDDSPALLLTISIVSSTRLTL